jgi:hypothetical protein
MTNNVSHSATRSSIHHKTYTKFPRITGFSDFVYWPVFWKLENTTLLKPDLFLHSGEGERPTLLGPLERENLITGSFYGTQQSRCLLPSHLMETDPVSETLCFLVSRILDDGQSPNI